LPVVKANADAGAVEIAVKTVTAIVNELASINQPAARDLAIRENSALLEALSKDDPSWLAVANGQVGLLDALARAEYADNARLGKLADNAQLSKTQQRLIDALAAIVARDVKQAPAAVEKLRASLQPWVAAGYFGVAEDAY